MVAGGRVGGGRAVLKVFASAVAVGGVEVDEIVVNEDIVSAVDVESMRGKKRFCL